jgi:hypothetical protein
MDGRKGTIKMISDFITVERAIELLNDLYEQDPEAMERFLMNGVPCSEKVVIEGDVIVQTVAPEHVDEVGSEHLYGLLAVINGMFGHEEGTGPIQLNFIAACPGECDLKDTEAKMGDKCPVCGKHELIGQGLPKRPFSDVRPYIRKFREQYVDGVPRA